MARKNDGGEAYVVLIGPGDTLDDVDEAAGVGHARQHVQEPRRPAWHAKRRLSQGRRFETSGFCDFF